MCRLVCVHNDTQVWCDRPWAGEQPIEDLICGLDRVESEANVGQQAKVNAAFEVIVMIHIVMVMAQTSEAFEVSYGKNGYGLYSYGPDQ